VLICYQRRSKCFLTKVYEISVVILDKFGAATRIHTKNKTVYVRHNLLFEKSGTVLGALRYVGHKFGFSESKLF